MKNKKKIIVITLSLLLVSILSIVTYNLSLNKEVIMSNHIIKNNDNGMLSLLLETGLRTGQYKESTSNTWPEKYTLNKTLSKCENGGTLEFDENNSKVSLKTKSSDKCYVYFDYPIPNVYVSANNIPTTYGALANLSCSGANSTYNEKYQRIEISQLSTKNASCNLSYTNRTSKTYLNDYIMGLSGTEQGTGKLVHEMDREANYDDSVNLTKEEYGPTAQNVSTTIIENVFSFDSTNNEWVSNPDVINNNKTIGTKFYLNFNIPSDGYYELCYELSAGNYGNTLRLYKNGADSVSVSGSSTDIKSGCENIGYQSANTTLNIAQELLSSSYKAGTFKFNLKKASSVKEYDVGYRYEGINPTNYVWFNNELWRIIGAFDENTHGIKDEYLVKIVRNESIGGLAWNKTNTSNVSWRDSNLNKILNGAYLNKSDGTSSGYCYGYSNISTANCDYRNIGIDTRYKNMIKSVTWHLGSRTGNEATALEFYKNERGTKVNTGPSNATGYIGLMYPSDYGYSVLSDSCNRATKMNKYYTVGCQKQTWLDGEYGAWSIILEIQSSTGGKVFAPYIISSVSTGNLVRPTLYLDKSVYVTSGDGSITNPYMIGM